MACKLGVAIYVVLQLIAFVAVMVGTGVDMFYNKPEHSSGARVFAIISILVYGAAFLFGFLLLYCCSGFRWLCLALNIVGAATACVVWAVMVVTYRLPEPKCLELSDGYNFGVGFSLFVFAWILDIVDIIFLMLPWQIEEFVEGEEPSEKEEEEQSENSKEYIEQE